MNSVFKKGAYSLPVAVQEVRLEFHDFSFGEFHDHPGQVWADFVHDTDEFVVVAKGIVEIEVGDQCATCHAGDLVLIPAHALHTLRTSKSGASIWYYGYGNFGGKHG